MTMNDQNFDGITKRFVKNIYGTSKGKLRHTILCDFIDDYLTRFDKPSLNIIDIGGGTGIMSKRLAEMGHRVTLVDASSEILDHAKAEMAGIDTLTYRHNSLYELNDIGDYDFVLCHAVLEWLASPQHAVEHIVRQLNPTSLLSLTFFNKDAAMFGNAVYGNFEYIAKGMKVKNQIKLNPNNPVNPSDVKKVIEQEGARLADVAGIRCFHDYLKKPIDSEVMYEELLDLERQYCRKEPYKWLGKYLHFLVSKG